MFLRSQLKMAERVLIQTVPISSHMEHMRKKKEHPEAESEYIYYFSGLLKKQLFQKRPQLLDRLKKAGRLSVVPEEYGDDLLDFYRRQCWGYTRHQLKGRCPEFIKRVQSPHLISQIPHGFGKNPYDYYEQYYKGWDALQLFFKNYELYSRMQRKGQLEIRIEEG